MKREFDRYAQEYDLLLNDAISVSGENKEYFSRARIARLSAILQKAAVQIESVLDFGCGTGSATPHFFECLPVRRLVGVDASGEMIDTANRIYGSNQATFVRLDEYGPNENFDLVFCNGVFHHVPKAAERAACLRIIRASLQSEGVFSFWENNPWNPGTRYVMRKCAFDKDAETISPPKARRMLLGAGFRPACCSYHFVFPRILRAFRVIEPLLAPLPIGAQYHILSSLAPDVK